MSTLKVNTITPQSGSTNQLSGSLLITDTLTVNDNITATAFTGSLFGTASFATTASFALNAEGGGGAGFPFTGSAEITGSLGITGSANGNVIALSISSNTASLNLEDGNFYTLTLVSGSTTRVNPSNISAGKTFTIKVKQASTLSGSITFDSAFKFPSFSAYLPTKVADAEDIISCITFDTASIYSTSTLLLK